MSRLWAISTATALLLGVAPFTTPALAGKGQSQASSSQAQKQISQSTEVTSVKTKQKTKRDFGDLHPVKHIDKAGPK